MYQKNFNVIYTKDEQDLVQTDSCEQVDIRVNGPITGPLTLQR